MKSKTNYLIIMRHAKSISPASSSSDFNRPLQQEGLHEIAAVAKKFATRGITVDTAVVSAAQRTKETYAALQTECHTLPTPCFEQKLYNSGAEDFIEVLKEYSEAKNLMVLGHNPSVSEVAHYYCGAYHEFKTADIAILSTTTNLKESLEQPKLFRLEAVLGAHDA